MADPIPFPVSDYDVLSPNYNKPHRATLQERVKTAVRGSHLYGALTFLRNFNCTVDGAPRDTGVMSAAEASTGMFYDTRTLAAGASDNLDLAGGVANFTKVHAIYVRGADANGSAVQVGAAAANPFKGPFVDVSDAALVNAGNEFLVTSTGGWAVTAGTADVLKVANGGAAAATYDIIILGE